MATMFRMHDWDVDFVQQTEARYCRTIDCGQEAADGTSFCTKCSDEINAVREAARRRFVIFGASGDDRREEREGRLRRA